jgi:hypothetical protein
MSSENIVALCDIDWQYAKKCFDTNPDAKRYVDFRRELEEMGKSIDAVVIATPDHTHAVCALAAMQLASTCLWAKTPDPLRLRSEGNARSFAKI